MATLQCPFCNDGRYFNGDRFVCCLRCGGSSLISSDDWLFYQSGQRMKQERIARGEHIEDAARRMGVSARELSLRENGWREGVSRLARKVADQRVLQHAEVVA